MVCGESYPCPPGRGLARYAAAGLFIADRLSKRDNALIGYCRAGLGDQPLEGAERRNQISFEVRGFPPAKSEALSMLGAGHSHAPRVRRLLEAAQQAREKQAFTPIESRRVALDVIVRAPAGQNPADATNYLGGIADVLEEKSHRGVLDHLGDLASVWLYRNDRQIKEVSYREVEADEAVYTVTVRALMFTNYCPGHIV